MGELRSKRVLVIDDELLMCRLIETIFTANGAKVETALSGTDGMEKLAFFQPDLVLLDVMMPGENGIEICRQIRDVSGVPIILLTALTLGEYVVQGLDAGADDYVTKPFDKEVLLARSRAVLRRTDPDDEEDENIAYNDGFLVVNLNARKVTAGKQPVKLSATEFKLLSYLLGHADETSTFEDILENVWGEPYRYSAEYVHVYVWRLRQKLEPDPKEPRYLVSEHGVGYKFKLMDRSP